MEPTVLVTLFAGLMVFSSWFSVPLTTINPQRPVAERLVGCFQLTAAAQGVSTLYCRFNHPRTDFSTLLNQTLPSVDPAHGETHKLWLSEAAAADSTPTEVVTSSLIPTPTAPFGGAQHVVFDNLFDNGAEYPEWFIASLGSLLGDHVRRHPNIYTVVAGLLSVQVLVMTWFARQIQTLTRESRQHSEEAGSKLVQAQLAEEQGRVNSLIAKLERYTVDFQSLDQRLDQLSATVNSWPQQIPKLVGDGLVQIRTQVDQFDAIFEQLRKQVNDLASAPEKNTGIDVQDTPFLQSLQDQVRELVCQWEGKPWELPHSELAVRIHGVNERLEQLTPKQGGDTNELFDQIKRLQKDLDQWKDSVVVNSEFANVEADLRLITKKVDSKPWTESITEVGNTVKSLNRELHSFKEISSALNIEQKSLASDVKLIDQFVNQLKAEQPWKRGRSLTEDQLTAVNEFMTLKGSLATKEDTRVLAEAIRRTEGSLESWISETWPVDLHKLEKSSRALEQSLKSEMDSTRRHCATHEDVKFACASVGRQVSDDLKILDKEIDSLKGDVNGLSAKVTDLAARPVGGSVQSTVTIEELLKVKDMAREADNSAISAELAVDNFRDRMSAAEREIAGTNTLLRYHEFDIASCAAKLGVQRKKVTFDGAPNPFGPAPTGSTAPEPQSKGEAKPDKPGSSTPASKEEKPAASQASPAATGSDSKSEPKSDKKIEQPSTGSASEESAKLEGKTETASKPSNASESVEPKPPGLEASMWATAGPTETKPTGLEASRWAAQTPEPKPAGLEASRWAPQTKSSPGGSVQKKGNSKKSKKAK
ncbi:uncharacterized protein CIMG_01799 [Coccidioides immitis RS]|uniref:Uncharacterized protein n=2 Tax=Coccidioides immitis TaxID=5501 RepID=J3KJY7_COCIM|nr:uncharacterized protein CIMG_01799 [Coccidioides immitis RS]EAS36445.3 hypothetical protein CIMG_01799 [Coccidioides immitis RS]